jgi:peptidyl-tRNA hydrolase, PTH1 family
VRLVVGLGNPGTRYAGTRHNAGQRVVEALAARLGAGRFAPRYAGRVAEARGPAGPVTLLVPTTFMNDSGRSVGPAAGALRAPPEAVLVVHDEIDLPFGTVRGKVGGGVAGHNGLRAVRAGLGDAGFPRVRIGVGRPPAGFRGDEADWVLMRFAEPASEVEALLGRALDMTETAVREGMDAAIARFHAAEPGSRARRRRAADGEEEGPPPADREGGDGDG